MSQALINAFAHAINCESRENASNTPDFILASYLMACLETFEAAVNARERWYGRTNDSPAVPKIIEFPTSALDELAGAGGLK